MERREDLDVAKGIGIILVLYGHALEFFFNRELKVNYLLGVIFDQNSFSQWQMIYSFHMPLFFFLSGISNSKILDKSFKQVACSSLQLIIIAYFTHLAAFLIQFAIFGYKDDKVLAVTRGALIPLLTGFGFANVVVWFLVSLAISKLLFYASFHWRSSLSWTAIAAALLLSFAQHLNHAENNYMQIKSLWSATLLFAAGYFVGKRFLYVPPIIGLVSLAFVSILSSWNYGCELSLTRMCELEHLPGHFGVMMITGRTGNVLLFYFNAMLGIIGIFGLTHWFNNKLVRWCGRHSLQLIIVNGFTFVSSAIKDLPYTGSQIGQPTIVAISTGAVILQIAFSWLLLKWINYFLDFTRVLSEKFMLFISCFIETLHGILRRKNSESDPNGR